jgi:hypothetical protein
MNSGSPEKTERKKNILDISVALGAAQIGCVTLVVVLAAIFLGLWLDQYFHTKPILTVVFVFGSIPVSVISMLLVARVIVKRIKTKNEQP